jgi:rare lipoprotein A
LLLFCGSSLLGGDIGYGPSVQTGFASYYNEPGEKTASGRPFSPSQFVAAHPSYPAGTVVRVTNLRNGRSVDVQIVDRGPAKKQRLKGVIIDLSPAAARHLRFMKQGRVKVRTRVIKWGDRPMPSLAID